MNVVMDDQKESPAGDDNRFRASGTSGRVGARGTSGRPVGARAPTDALPEVPLVQRQVTIQLNFFPLVHLEIYPLV